MDFWKRLFGGDSRGSSQKAKDRLRIVLIHDRNDISPQLLEQLRKEMIEVLTKYMDIDTKKIELDLDHDEQEVALVANIPVLRIKRGEVDINIDTPQPSNYQPVMHESTRDENPDTVDRLRRANSQRPRRHRNN